MSLLALNAALAATTQRLDAVRTAAQSAGPALDKATESAGHAKVAADGAKRAAEAANKATQDFLDAFIRGHPKLGGQVVFGEGATGTADLATLATLIRNLRDNKLEPGQDPATLRAWMDKMAATIQRFIDPGFVLQTFIAALNRFDAMQRQKAQTAPRSGSGGASAGGISLNIRFGPNGKPIIDILNDSGGGFNLLNWYKPDDPDYLKMLNSTGRLGGGW